MLNKLRRMCEKPGKTITPRNLKGNFGDFERLEDKRLLAFTGSVDGDTLNIVQTADDGMAQVYINSGEWTVTDDAGTVNLGTADNVNVEILEFFTGDVSIELHLELPGDLSVDLGEGWANLGMAGSINTILGDLHIQGGEFAQTVDLTVCAPLNVGGTANIDLGAGWDQVSLRHFSATIGNDFHLRGINNVTTLDNGVSVGGDLNFEVVDFINTQVGFEGGLIVDGNLNYYPSGSDTGHHQTITREFRLPQGSQIGGDIYVNTGNGDSNDINKIELVGGFNGARIDVIGGFGTDEVTWGTANLPAIVNVKLKSGDDVFKINPWTMTPESLRVDFGSGNDHFTNDYRRPFDFDARLLNLDGYNAIFDANTGNLDINQVSDTGDLVIDNNGMMDQEIRFTANGDTTLLTAANDIRVVLMDHTSTHVVTNFANPRVGNTVLQLRSGNRNVSFEGTSNIYEGLLRIEAADGVQSVDVAVNADLNVDGTFIFNGRDGSDALMAGNAVSVSGAMLLRGVNNFVNNAGLDVGGDFNMISLLENQDTRLISNHSFNVDGNFTYLGGGGVDAINFKSNGASVGGFTYVDIAESTHPTLKQRVLLTGGFSTSNLVVDGDSAAAGNVFTTDAQTQVMDEVIVNFSGSNTDNTASFFGTYGGTYGTYRGSAGCDYVTFGANPTDMLFASLMGSNDDVFTIAPTAEPDFLYVDFGHGSDSLDNEIGESVPFNHNIFNL